MQKLREMTELAKAHTAVGGGGGGGEAGEFQVPYLNRGFSDLRALRKSWTKALEAL